jgi:COP9 signalosome complex subunit 5
LQHTYSGVDKGIKGGGKPIEVMGLLLGRPHPDDPKSLVITDAFPLPIEGFETRVIADDQDVINYMVMRDSWNMQPHMFQDNKY